MCSKDCKPRKGIDTPLGVELVLGDGLVARTVNLERGLILPDLDGAAALGRSSKDCKPRKGIDTELHERDAGQIEK